VSQNAKFETSKPKLAYLAGSQTKVKFEPVGVASSWSKVEDDRILWLTLAPVERTKQAQRKINEQRIFAIFLLTDQCMWKRLGYL
jgi:hypothetical protein